MDDELAYRRGQKLMQSYINQALAKSEAKMTKDELNELHEWLIDASGSTDSPFESRMLMRAATIVGEKFTGEKPAVEPNGDEAHNLAVQFDILLDNTLVPNEPLEVYSSNSFRRVGLKSQYREVLYATRDRSDGHPNFSNYALLDALVCAFNAMLARRAENRTAEPR
jgi:hypothetical protein